MNLFPKMLPLKLEINFSANIFITYIALRYIIYEYTYLYSVHNYRHNCRKNIIRISIYINEYIYMDIKLKYI